MKFYNLYVNSKIIITDEEVNNFFKKITTSLEEAKR